MDTAAEQTNEQPREERKDSKVDTDDIKTEESTLLEGYVCPDGSVTIPRKTGTYHTRSVILLHGVFDSAEGWAEEFMRARLNGETIMSIFPGTNWCFPDIDYPWLVQDIGSETRKTTDNMVDLWSAFSATDQEGERLKILGGLVQILKPIQQLVERGSDLVGIRNVFIGGLADGATAAMHLFLIYQVDQDGGMGGFIGMNGVLPFQSEIKPLIDKPPKFEKLSLEEYIDEQILNLEKVVTFMRNTLGLPAVGTFDRTIAYLGNPIFLGSIMTRPDELELRQKREDMIEILRRLRCFHPIYFTNDFKGPDLAGQVEGLVDYLRMTGSIRVPG
ncbi:hypothetical protein BELL_0204g00140 [Botrytis elliptica]|uniref:Phospholipase/carboxylesterase/thioesterase domain-containing protein n=1 Tax=Botrytis elliptica TaxID=278938 RepID=A0A4Z1JPU0_9HELO|nr:hypothetical protein EAE99_009143 [Botrytis elliptica]TGO75598.1 hypothetical protein BELL_0204g00140 [Botrytis elliptica]